MAGFSSFDQIIQAMANGQKFDASWGKNFNPSAAAVANEWHTLFRGGGNPPADAIFDAGTALAFQGVTDVTASAGAMPHGGDVQTSGFYKYLASAHAVTAAATTVPATLALVDVIGFYRVASVTTTTEQATTNTLGYGDTFTANASTDVCTWTSSANYPSNVLTGTRIQVSSTGTLPGGLSPSTNYYFIRISDTTFKLATSYANAIAGTAIDITSAGSGTHTLTRLLPRYTNGAGVQAIFFNPQATALGAATPALTITYTNSNQVASRATPTLPSAPIGKSGATNSHILYTGATGAGKYNYVVPLQAGDAGIAEIAGIRNNASYVSGMYTVALIKEIARFPLSTIGLASERNFINEFPSLPRIYDGAALYFLVGSGAATPANSAFSGLATFVWN
jgi:hypothetical protein